jgi:hypothetical protein
MDAFEKALSQLEGDAASVLRMIAGDEWPQSEEQRTGFATFTACSTFAGQTTPRAR